MKPLWAGQNTGTKIRILRACIFPTATYGCETWTMNKTIAKRINAFEMKCYRRLLRVPWTEHRTNQSIRSEINVKENWLENFIRYQKLKYFGHIKRHDVLGKTILEGMVEGKRSRGRPSRQWEKDITETLNMSTTVAGRTAENRSVFRQTIKDAISTPG